MGFKVNYHTEVIALLSVLILSVNTSANANIPQHTIVGKVIDQNNYTVPPPTMKIPEPIPEPKPVNQNELRCLAEAVYFESKSEPIKGQKAVAHVIVNRTKNPKFPNTICRVVNQRHNSVCQFSYKCGGKPLAPKNKENYELAMNIAQDILDGEADITKGAMYFHNNTVKPAWAKASKLTMVIGNHKFYRG